VVSGTVIASFASSIGATFAFLTSRYLLHDSVQKRFGDRLKPINEGVKKDGAFYLFTLRLVPIFPFFLINLLLGLFNIVPGFPLDGGRVLRSILWAITRDLTRATRWASGAGQLFAWILMGIGVMNVFAGGLVQGLWLVLIGWFLNNAARMSYQQLLVREALKNVPVARVMQTGLERIPPDLSIERFVREHLMASDQHAFPVELRGQMLGLVTFDDVRKVPHPRWGDTTVEQVMTPAAQLSMLPPDAAAERALDELTRRDADEIPVLEGTQLLGLVRRRDLMKWLALQSGGSASARPRGI